MQAGVSAALSGIGRVDWTDLFSSISPSQPGTSHGTKSGEEEVCDRQHPGLAGPQVRTGSQGCGEGGRATHPLQRGSLHL